jgi:hypothetical protein
MTRQRPFTTYRRGDPHPESGARTWRSPPPAPKTVHSELQRPGTPQPKPPIQAKATAEPITSAKKKAYAGAKRGPKERPEWKAIARRLRTLRRTNKLPDRNAAVHAVKDWLAGKGREMANDTIYKGVDRHCPDWWDEILDR